MTNYGIKIGIHNGPAVDFKEGAMENNKVFVPRTAINKEMVQVHLNVKAKTRTSRNNNNIRNNNNSRNNNRHKAHESDKSNNEIEAIIFDDLISDTSSVEDESTDKVSSREDNLEELKHVDYSIKDTKNKKFHTLYVVSDKFWHIYVPLKQMRISNEEFEAKATELFPLSFLWLLRECARTISVSICELYAAVLSLEKMTANYDKRTRTLKYK